jgi:membrane protease YdiL (CAAX protease family)
VGDLESRGDLVPVARLVSAPRDSAPPPAEPWKLYRSVLGSLALVAAGIVGYFVVQVIGGVFVAIWLLLNGTPVSALNEGALAPYLPTMIAFSPLASLAILGALAFTRQLAPDPREPRASLATSLVVAIVSAAATIGGAEALSHIQMRLGIKTEEQSVILEAFKVCPRWMLYGAVAFLAPLGEELLFRRFAFATLKIGTNRFVAYAITALVFATVHLNFSAFFSYLLIGLGTAFAYDRTGRIEAAIAVHAINNGFAVFMNA